MTRKDSEPVMPTTYSENTLMFSKWIGNTIIIRPDIRFDRSWDLKAYNNGKNNNQFTFAADLIYKF